MDWRYFESKLLAASAYDGGMRILYLRFRSGATLSPERPNSASAGAQLTEMHGSGREPEKGVFASDKEEAWVARLAISPYRREPFPAVSASSSKSVPPRC
jgi:hypothetical protein